MGLLNRLHISLEEDNVIIPSAMMFCHWVINMEAIHLPLNRLPRGLVWSSNNWSPSDYPYLSHDGFKIVSIFLCLVINGFLVCPLTNLIVFLNKLLEPSPLDQLLYLFFQILALICVMSMVFMEVAVLLWISSLQGQAQWLRPFQDRSSLICMRILSTGIIKGVKFNFFFDDASWLLLLVLASVWLSWHSFFLLWDSAPSSFFRLPVNSFAVSLSSPFMCFWALNKRSVIDVGGLFPKEKTRSRLFSPA